MSEVITMKLIDTAFWLLLLIIIISKFQNELRQLLQSLNSLKLAGATFKLKSKKETLRSYILLAETLIDFLSKSDQIEELRKLMHPSEIEKLGDFALQYTDEVPESNWNEQLLRNIALLLLRFGRTEQSINLYDALLKNRPNEGNLLNLKALALMTSRMPNNVKTAEEMLASLVDRFPENNVFRFNLALTLSLLKKGDDAVKQMQRAIDDGYWKNDEKCLNDVLFHYVRG